MQGATALASMVGAAVAHDLAGDTSAQAKMTTTGAVLVAATTSLVFSLVFHRNSKTEFKEFMLKSEDAADGVSITFSGNAVNFSAKSGQASASVQKVVIPASVQQEYRNQLVTV